MSHVFDGWEIQDSQYHPFPNIYRIHWQKITDISGIEEIVGCLSSIRAVNECNLHPKVKISDKAASYTFTNISLHSGIHCYAYLGVNDKAGNFGNFWSNGALIDTSPPKKGQVVDGHEGSDRIYQRETNILYATWSGFFENESSIHHYELAFGTSPNDFNVQPFINIGLITSSPSSNLLVSELKMVLYITHKLSPTMYWELEAMLQSLMEFWLRLRLLFLYQQSQTGKCTALILIILAI